MDMEEEQTKIIAENEAQPASEAVEKKGVRAPKQRKRKIKVPGREGARLKLQKFDFILLQLLREGRNDFPELLQTFKVDENDFKERLKLLAENNLLSFDQEFKSVKLTIKGVNEYSEKWKRAADNWLGRKEKRQRAEKSIEKSEKFDAKEGKTDSRGDKPAAELIDLEKTIQAKLPIEFLLKELELRRAQILELPEEKRAEETIDLMELMRKFGPTEEQKRQLKRTSPFIERHYRKKERKMQAEGKTAVDEKALSTVNTQLSEPAEKGKPYYNRAISELSQQAANLAASGEKCELCKMGFMISVKQEEHNPKYGHCFCGAPYHKDCHEGVMAGDSKCVRCGRKLTKGADFKVEEAFKEIRDISF